ncbi:hypothetical protein M758_10G183600 [Ceratodon purpureus]|uniref:Uncharacterized protein n=1 Tax=Ceratodon purpureus TaxID=3225 RepID=A0A8T0GPM2_CERPU|nr:hypothetical protein KC19_10G188300 [Ceratodon purpureus]KAG0604601.1 hypothetical protein M758_10G183600 [Ceratodon purpureus]
MIDPGAHHHEQLGPKRSPLYSCTVRKEVSNATDRLVRSEPHTRRRQRSKERTDVMKAKLCGTRRAAGPRWFCKPSPAVTRPTCMYPLLKVGNFRCFPDCQHQLRNEIGSTDHPPRP